jgi:glutamyl-Q tRNA(Asp) synthetase
MALSDYRGRFAPSPTGPLHFGSLVAAVASYADARNHHGEWLVRIEDVDETRRRDEAERTILQGLLAFGMQWDAEPVRQSARKALYDRALRVLTENDRAYRCNCSRKTLAKFARLGTEGPIYPGTCLRSPPATNAKAAWRIRVTAKQIEFTDRVCGTLKQCLDTEIGDFVIRRIDGFTAYQLAVVVDDDDQGITDVVRGADLLWSTPRQIWLQQQLSLPVPRYAHVPLIYGSDGKKLSKRDRAHPIDESNPVPALEAAWRHLGQQSPGITFDNPNDFWHWAIPRWHIERVPRDPSFRHD